MNVAVVGIGRIGLPVATGIAARGHSVVGCDIDERRVAMVNRGENPIPDEAGLGELLAEVVRAGNLRATTSTAAAVAEASTVLFAVAVDVDRDGHADLTSLLAACDAVASGMQAGTLCIFDTTLPVGTTRSVLARRLEQRGMVEGRDFEVAFSPERLLMGRVIEDLTKYPKVVGGLTPEAGRRAAAFFREVLGGEVMELPSAEAAELSKLAEGAYRDLNIALANELAQVADVHHVDIADVLRAANSQPYSHIHVPGTGVGGHCIPVYPQFLMQGEGPSSLSARGRHVNDEMPAYAVRRIAEVSGPLEGKRVLVLGLTFRPDVAVVAHTNASDLLRELEAAGVIVEGHDPLLSAAGIEALGFSPARSPEQGYDVAIVHANHRAYRDLNWSNVAPLIVDARNALNRSEIEGRGLRYLGIGRPVTPAR
ncbi:MAG: nucleotide sugar dehydrogenase [Dehalococcoidia bacterium]|nr:nucleotide sugar dehydrogenase [Dehalococcoidia bacterium]MCB9486907.1 nucleotide sugar dehydrogenase [Thermoflexaceae bacterium]